MNVMVRVLILAAWMAGAEAAAVAQQGVPDAFRACAGIASGEARLACYDAASGRTPGAGSAAKADSPAAPALSATVESAAAGFGKAPERRVEPDELKVMIVRVQRRDNGKLLFLSDSGQAWAQTDSTALRNLGDGPWPAVVRKAALGSFLLSLDGGAAVRVRRDQ
jgi:hypothetical protein